MLISCILTLRHLPAGCGAPLIHIARSSMTRQAFPRLNRQFPTLLAAPVRPSTISMNATDSEFWSDHKLGGSREQFLNASTDTLLKTGYDSISARPFVLTPMQRIPADLAA